jgi:hypothetical protein
MPNSELRSQNHRSRARRRTFWLGSVLRINPEFEFESIRLCTRSASPDGTNAGRSFGPSSGTQLFELSGAMSPLAWADLA